MNKDQEAFEEWFKSTGYYYGPGFEHHKMTQTVAWKAACEYKDKQYLSGSVMKSYHDRREDALERVRDLEHEVVLLNSELDYYKAIYKPLIDGAARDAIRINKLGRGD